jgi:acetoin utilization deacetylase AcuC-like enzyme
VDAVERVVQGESTGAFALVRPPGHHARPDAAMGFCLLNNVAIAAEHAVREGGCRRVLVLDPDVHHGNGTQEAFWERDDVLYVSTHRFPFYPGTGAPEETGAGAGSGFTVNLPLSAGAGDADLLHLHERVVAPIVREWEPDLILVSAGFDTWRDDPLGGLSVGEEGFRALFALYRSWADACCPGRLAFVLEGGYDPAGLVAGVRAALEAAAGPGGSPSGVGGAPSDSATATASRVRHLHAARWRSLAR